MGAPPSHAPLAGAMPQTPRFCSGIESLMSNKPVYKIKNKSKKHKNSIQVRSGFHLENLAKSYTNRYNSNISENTHFSHNTPLSEIVLECSIYPIETIKIRFVSSLNFTSKNWLGPIKIKCNISKSIHFCNGLPAIKQAQNGPFISQKA